MNRVVAWGISSTIGFVFKTVLEELAREELQEYTKTFFQKTFPTLQELQVQDKLELAFGQALKELLQLVQDELENADCSDAEIKQYIYPLKKFIRHRIVLVELGKPFGAGICHADSFAKTWCELNLKPLPDEFAWEEIIKRYIKQVNAIRKESHDLHTLFNLPNKAIEQNRKENAASVPNFGLFDLEDYRKTIEKTYGYLKLDSFATDGYSYKLKLEKMFVPQNVREVQEAFPQVYERPKEHLERLERLKKNNQLEEYEEYAEYVDISPEVLERYKQAYREQTTRSVEEMIEDERNYQYTVILGDPGSGKSSLLQYLALKWAEAPIEKVSAMPIPLLVELRTYVQNRDNQKSQNSLDFFQQYKGFIYSINLQQLSHFLQTGKGFVMFDGLDEIFDPNQREEVIIDIINFTKTYPGVRVIVTSRVIGYKPQLLGNAKFRHFMLQDLELEQIEHFLETWHDLAFGNSYEKERKRERLRAAIHAYAPIRELAGNPLLLTMMAILNRNQELPRFRAELYNKASRVLLQQWDVERALVDKTISVDYKDKQAILRQVAYHMQTNKKGGAGNLINSEKLERILNSYLQKIKVNNSTNVAKLIIQQLRERNFILCFMGADYYAFVHRTFLEYFCATEYVWQFEEERSITLNELKTDIFGKYWQDESWHEVLRLIAGMLNARFIGEIIDELMEKNGEAQKFSNLFLAAQCFSEVKDSESISPTATRLLEQLKKLTNYDLHYYYDPYALEETSLVFKIRTQAVAAVATTWKDDPETLSWLKTRATSDEDYDVRRAAVEELAKAFKDDPETLTILKTSATSDEHYHVRRAAVEELAKAFKDDPETLTILNTRATSDKHSNVRRAAVQELAKAFKDDPETLSWLKTRATSDEDYHVRRAAVQELAKAFKDDPETLSWLKTRATSNEDYHVRTAAVEELAKAFKDDPETLSWLKTRATSDEDYHVRTAAVQELAKAFKDDPETLSWLKTRATSDEDYHVRTAAVQELAKAFKDDLETLSWLKTRATSDEDYDVRRAAVQELAKAFKDDPEILSWLKTRATSDKQYHVRRAAVQELAKAFKDDPETLTILKNCATSDKDYDVRRAAVQELAKAFKDDPETLTILKNCATSDKHSNVRRAAVQELAKAFKDDPETLTILKTRATSDEDYHVRTAAVQELAKAFKDDPETLTILKTRATNDEDYHVRTAAVEELAKAFKNDPETLSWLKTRATSDEDYDVRRAAVQELAKAFKDDPETLSWLKNRATSDEDYHVRRAAVQELAKAFKDDPETLSWLKNRATSDEDYHVRRAAVEELAKAFKDDPGMFGLLCNIAVNDPFKRNYDFENNPRQIALAAIIQQYPDNRQILPVLRNRAKKDRDRKVRDFAKKELRKRGVKIRWYESLLRFFP